MRRGLIVFTAVAALVLGAAVAVPSALQARKHGSEASSIGALKSVASSEPIFREGDKAEDGTLDDATLTELRSRGLTDSVLGGGQNQGYFYGSASGDRHFDSNQSGVIFYNGPSNLDLDTYTLPANGVIPTGDSHERRQERPLAPARTEITRARRLATSEDLRPRAPALLARPNGPALEALPLEAIRISAVLGATRARVLVDCTFRNTSSARLEGTLMVSLPEGASPCYLGTFQGDGPSCEVKDLTSLIPPASDPVLLLEPGFSPRSEWKTTTATVDWGALRPARVVEEAKGKAVYEQTTRRRVDPALMEWSGGNKFSARIFPIAPNGRKRVVFAFDQTPREVGGRTVVALPVPSPLPPAARVEVAADGRAYEKPALLVGEKETALEGGVFPRATATPDAAEKGAFLLAATPRSARVRAGFATGDGLPGSLVHARIAPDVRRGAERPTGDAVFVLDTSLSQRARLAPSFGRLLRAILERDETIRRFRVLAFDVRARELTAGWCPNAREAREPVLGDVEHVWLEGATHLDAALASLEGIVAADEHPTFFLLSDAEVTWGVEDARELERAHARLFGERWIAYQIGDAPIARPLVERLARSGGRVVSVVSAAEVEAAALAHRAAPTRLEGVAVEGAAASDLVVAGAPRSIFPGQVLEVGFRVGEGVDPRRLAVTVRTESGPQSFGLADAAPGDALAGRACAELAASALVELRDEAADKVVLALSQSFALANRVASFLILETDAEYSLHALEPAAVDVAALTRAATAKAAERPVGAPDLSLLAPESRAFLEAVRARRAKAWARPDAGPPRGSFERPSWPAVLDPIEVHREAERRHSAGRTDDALRIVSSIVEENPRDERALRLVGYCLMSWGLYEEAADLFARTRTLRPFEPQAWLCEALALEGQGLVGEAAVRYEIVLAGSFDPRYDQFAKLGSQRLYARLLPALGAQGVARASEITKECASGPAFESVLFWSIDDTDIDLHTIEKGGGEVDYRSPTSRSGGRLHWDNTTGLGPEVYTHPTDEPVEQYVHYYATSSVAGTVPAATLLLGFKSRRDPVVSCAVLGDRKDRVTVWSGAAR